MNDDPVSEAELAAIEARVRAASPAPWHSWIEGRDACGGEDVVITANGEFYFHVRTYLEDRPLRKTGSRALRTRTSSPTLVPMCRG